MDSLVIRLDTKGMALPGLDRSLLDEDISTEVTEYASKVSGVATKKEKPAPEGSQGEGAIEWIIDQIKDPDMAKVYAGILIYSLNRILTIAQKKANKEVDDSESEKGKKKASSIVEVKAFNKFILLPAAGEIIKEFLESIGAE